MSKTHCKEGCDFLHYEIFRKPRCLIYKQELDLDNEKEACKRLEICVQESRKYKIEAQIQDIRDYYDSFVCEMDIMFENLERLMKGEK